NSRARQAPRHASGAPPRRPPPSTSVIVHVDTSALVDALTGPRRSLGTMIRLTEQGERLALSTIVLYEWLRGPRTLAELSAQEELFPRETAVAFGAEEAAVAARLYGRLRPSRRGVHLA